VGGRLAGDTHLEDSPHVSAETSKVCFHQQQPFKLLEKRWRRTSANGQ
jgi:hypothetical protein